MARREAKEVALRKLARRRPRCPRSAELYPGGALRRHAEARRRSPAPSPREPEIIFFDEPTTGLDPIMSDVINKLIVKCVRDLGATAVSITHDMVSARHIADRIAMIYEGRIIWNGPAGRRSTARQPLCRAVHPGRRRRAHRHARSPALGG